MYKNTYGGGGLRMNAIWINCVISNSERHFSKNVLEMGLISIELDECKYSEQNC